MAKVIIIKETVLQSIVKDLVSGAVLLGCTAIGWLLHADALEWIGGIIFVIWTGSRLSGSDAHMTITQARRFLDSIDSDPPTRPDRHPAPSRD